MAVRLPTRAYLASLPLHDAAAILSALERDLVSLLKDQASIAFDRRGSAYHCWRFRKKLKRIAEMRQALRLV